MEWTGKDQERYSGWLMVIGKWLQVKSWAFIEVRSHMQSFYGVSSTMAHSRPPHAHDPPPSKPHLHGHGLVVRHLREQGGLDGHLQAVRCWE